MGKERAVDLKIKEKKNRKKKKFGGKHTSQRSILQQHFFVLVFGSFEIPWMGKWRVSMLKTKSLPGLDTVCRLRRVWHPINKYNVQRLCFSTILVVFRRERVWCSKFSFNMFFGMYRAAGGRLGGRFDAMRFEFSLTFSNRFSSCFTCTVVWTYTHVFVFGTFFLYLFLFCNLQATQEEQWKIHMFWLVKKLRKFNEIHIYYKYSSVSSIYMGGYR